ncbi:uncharacterized protein LOC135695889 [Rhopilema esculentum]|uniref:uncharacterized protein LOC135695889 n=1 Tax=Rhopilema esculentum TaxID=499914 RepID=UPI0031DA48C5|eukprot:gene12316-2961_t
MSDYLRKGYLLKCPQKGRAFKKWNSRWFVLYGNSPRGRVRLEYYDNEKAWQQERGKRIIPLVHCVSIKPVWNKDYNNVLEIVTSDKTFYLGAGNKDEEKAWFKSLCKVVFGNANRNSIVQVLDRPDPFDVGYNSLDRGTDTESNLSRCQSSALGHSSPQLSKIMGSREKLGLNTTGTSDLNITISSTDTIPRNAISSMSGEISSLVSFESGFDDAASVVSSVTEAIHRFYVTVRPTIASQEAGMTGHYMLQITPTMLTLLETGTDNLIAEWQIQHLRRYGRGRTKFSFEAGDKCQTGIGVYTFSTMEGDQIFHLVHMYAERLSSLQRKDQKEKRISLPADTFKPLSETRLRAKSEGKLVDSTDDVSVQVLTDSLGHISTNIKSASSTQNPFPSKNRACTLDVIKDHEGGEKTNHLYGSQRPRSNTDISIEKEAVRRILGSQDNNPIGESTESLLQNPANYDYRNGLEATKSQPVDVGHKIRLDNEERPNKEENIDVSCERNSEFNENKFQEEKLSTVTDYAQNELTGIESKTGKDEFQDEEPRNIEMTESKAPADTLLNKEQANIDNINGDTQAFDKNENEPIFHTNTEIENISVDELTFDKGVPYQVDGPSSDIKTDTENTQASTYEKKSELNEEDARLRSSKRQRSRKLAQRNKSFEFGSMSEKTCDSKKHSGSFSSFDYRKYRENNEPVYKIENGPRKLQRFASVKKTVEMYEKISSAATEARHKSYTLWKRKSLRSSQKPEISKRTNDSNMLQEL